MYYFITYVIKGHYVCVSKSVDIIMICHYFYPVTEGEEEYYYTSKILYQHTKYNYGRKQIAKKPYGAN